VAGRVAQTLEGGGDLEEALTQEGDVFPPMFLALSNVGEQTGMLPEVFGELEKYYTRQQALRRQFWAQATWPVIQFVLAILVVAGLILVLGMLPQGAGPNGERFDPLGLGLSGPSGALIFLGCVGGILGGLFAAYLIATRVLKKREGVDAFFLRIPVVGPCLRALALARFSLALRLTTETGMAIQRALRLSLRATGNYAFMAASPAIEGAVKAGDDITLALDKSGLFPEEYRNVIAVAEEAGRLNEVLRQQADHYDEESGRRLKTLTSVAGSAVWLFVGGLIVVVIFRIFLNYLSILDSIH
jgi:type IV pilus assembly protein PilC